MLFVPAINEGEGIGHLRRCLELLESFPGAALYFDAPSAEEEQRVREVARTANLLLPEERLVAAPPSSGRWDLVVLDRRATSVGELERFTVHGPVVAIDEGGKAREVVPYLIDTLPSPPERSRANVFSPAFHTRPSRRRLPGAGKTGRVLITFGGEDPEGLSPKMASALIEEGQIPASRITLVIGPLFRSQTYPPAIELLRAPPDLRERLCDYDVVFTSFGLTAYEAVNAGTAVVLLNPTLYHRRLSLIAGFPEVGVRTVDRSALKHALADPQALERSRASISSDSQRSIPAHIRELDLSAENACPACGTRNSPSVARFVDRTFFRCARCTIIFELDFSREKQHYDKRYFFEDYRDQYGKTYLEDFENIRGFASGRLRRIEELGSPLEQKRLLDVGCAYGPFLLEARHRGAEVFGIDVAQEAVQYVRSSLELPCACTSLETLDMGRDFGVDTVNVVTMWYVIEHLPQLSEALRKVNRLLPVGGIFAFSTPNLAGISGRSDLERYLASSPRDHFTLWEPRSARTVLERFGFRVREVHVTGHHPERFPSGGATGGLRYKLLRRYSELARLGDTFECYAVKESEILP